MDAELKRVLEERKKFDKTAKAERTTLRQIEDSTRHRETEVEKMIIEKEKLLQKIREMEKKLLKGEKQGGIEILASKKAEKLLKSQERLSKRSFKINIV